MRLVASKYRGSSGIAAAAQKNDDFLNGEYGKVIIPEEILEGVRAIREHESSIQHKGETPAVQQEGEDMEVKEAGSLPLPCLSTSASTGSAKRRSNSRSRLPTPPHGLMSALTVSPPSPHQAVQPNSYHHSIYTRQLELLRQQHAYRPYPFADVPMVDQEMGFLYMPPIQREPQPHSTFQDQTVRQQSQMEFSYFYVRDFPGLGGTEEEAQADTEEPSQSAGANQSPVEPEREHESAITTENEEPREKANIWVGIDDKEDETEKDIDLEAEVAAESLLNLHSTPLRAPEDEDTFELPSHPNSRPAPPPWKLLDAPPIASPVRDRLSRGKSFIQPFKDPRREATRSLSFEQAPRWMIHSCLITIPLTAQLQFPLFLLVRGQPSSHRERVIITNALCPAPHRCRLRIGNERPLLHPLLLHYLPGAQTLLPVAHFDLCRPIFPPPTDRGRATRPLHLSVPRPLHMCLPHSPVHGFSLHQVMAMQLLHWALFPRIWPRLHQG